MSNDIEIYLTERACCSYDFHKYLQGETSCFSLKNEVAEWLSDNNVVYELKDCYYYMNNIDLHSECSSFEEVLSACRPKIIFNNKENAMLFKLTWN